MKESIKNILSELKASPLSFINYSGNGVQKGNLLIYGYGNGALISLIRVELNGSIFKITWDERRLLEIAIRNWYKVLPLEYLRNNTNEEGWSLRDLKEQIVNPRKEIKAN